MWLVSTCTWIFAGRQVIAVTFDVYLSQVQQIDALFHKIDWSSDGAISWDEFCTYMQLEYAEKEDSYVRSREIAFHLPARTRNMPHREPVLKIMNTSDGTFLACSQDGLMTFWSSQMKIKRSKTVITAVSAT